MAGRLLLSKLTLIGTASLVAITAILAVSASPTAANPQLGFASVSAGDAHTCAVTTSEGVKCWGIGLLGNGSTTSSDIPVDVSGLSTAATVSTGFDFSCAVTTTGAAKCWGSNAFGKLGDGTTTTRTTPVDVAGLSSGVEAISTGKDFACALMSLGDVKCWGKNDSGQLGDGTTLDRHVPTDVVGLTSGVTAVAAGSLHACAILVSGGVDCWGNNAVGSLGVGSTSPVRSPTPLVVAGLSDATSITAGGGHTCVLTSIGQTKCWGLNSNGQLGDGTIVSRYTSTLVVNAPAGITSIAAGDTHTCASSSTGMVHCWGSNKYGGIGDGTRQDRHTPVEVSSLPALALTTSAGAAHSCALLADSTISCWGLGYWGALGSGSRDIRPLPVQVVMATAKPTPTTTPCPTGGCPTATVTPSRTPTPAPGADLDLSIGVDPNNDTVDDCNTGNGSTNCLVGVGTPFKVKTYLNSLSPSVPSYGGAEFYLSYAGVSVSVGSANLSAWPQCSYPASNYQLTFVAFGCAVGSGSSTYTGVLGEVTFNCLDSGEITLMHGNGLTEITDLSLQPHYETGPDETLQITCDTLPTPTPTVFPSAVGGASYDSTSGRSALLFVCASVLLVVLTFLVIRFLPSRNRVDNSGA